ncbi:MULTISPECIES: hypothetical protein [Enterococcus]|jgi:sugar O-acyltransferase (sialic acid O-acetyltransferase NeuD family)|uniref:hypothetical protein n=1 Tax=Enterococcus TaxID=1350 RepID=UPI00088F44BE|nr:hypothetical protein [Enterococcus casseliflavus]MBV6371498.1 sialic acid O-acetyltransferase NeuD family sugar O-acyltransferase [Enterococcus casseliflavus]WEL46385.1 sialic acid O-acetyltransferase NeuD family sugar O-acyltransferase [Enterococcus casseliflavus]SDJ87479.1 sugar O-acyltransferase, sialic acid O-acetyltransferase NeuD family [Enterococcus casseliflavus]
MGAIDKLVNWKEPIGVAIGVASPKIKGIILEKLKKNKNLKFPNLIDPTALIGFNIKFGEGNVVMANTTFVADINIGNFNMINIGSTIGHDSTIGDFNSIYPTVSISGHTLIQNNIEIGVGAKLIQNISIGDSSIVGAGSVVIRNIDKNTKNVGNPTRVIESWE